jgi:crotonobetainyl-CoA:carnitine CoA-transferase CaiB-like acyl-CoA transferase
MTAPLAGIRVVEIASFVAAPAAGALLADLGADVVKVEVTRGEVYRYSTPRTAGIKSDFPEAPHFQMDNRGKRSLTLDVTREPAREALLRVIAHADVVLTNMLPERQEKYGIDAAALRARWPELIYASMSGYGPVGSAANEPAFDYTAYWARTGFMNALRDDGASPSFLRPGVGDHAAALAAVAGILAALRVREQTGTGQVVDVNLMHMGFYIQGNDAANTLATGEPPPNHDRRRPRNPLWNHYETMDGRWLFLVMIESDRYWPELCNTLGLDEVVDEERFTGPVNRYRNSEELTALLAARIGERSLDDWRKQLEGRRLIWSPVQTLSEAIHDAQAEQGEMFQEIDHPVAGSFQSVAPPIRLSGFDMRSRRSAPELGADSRAVLAEAGLSDDEIDRALSAALAAGE